MEKRVFSNGLTSPMSSSDTVRPSPNHKQCFRIHSYEKMREQSPLGYCSVTTKGMSRIRQACNSLFEVSIIWGKYLIVGRNFSCMSQSKRTEFCADRGATRWAMRIITGEVPMLSVSMVHHAVIGRIDRHGLWPSASLIFRAQSRTFFKWRNSSTVELFIVFSFFEYLSHTVTRVMSQPIHDNQLIVYVFIYLHYFYSIALIDEIRRSSISSQLGERKILVRITCLIVLDVAHPVRNTLWTSQRRSVEVVHRQWECLALNRKLMRKRRVEHFIRSVRRRSDVRHDYRRRPFRWSLSLHNEFIEHIIQCAVDDEADDDFPSGKWRQRYDAAIQRSVISHADRKWRNLSNKSRDRLPSSNIRIELVSASTALWVTDSHLISIDTLESLIFCSVTPLARSCLLR